VACGPPVILRQPEHYLKIQFLAQRKHRSLPLKKKNWRMLSKNIIAVYSENYIKSINTFLGKVQCYLTLNHFTDACSSSLNG
jgi:hypothetical protein